MRNWAKAFHAIAIAAILIGGGAAAAQETPDAFSIRMPDYYGGFAKQTQTAKSPEGTIETTNWIAKAPSGEAVVVTVSRMPAKILDPQKLITSTRASLLKSLGATLESEEPRPGEGTSVRALFRSSNAFFRARLTVVDDRLYQILYVGRSAEQRSGEAVGQIFESFRIKS